MRWRGLVIVAALAIQFIGLYTPQVPGAGPPWWYFPGADKLIHLAMFGLITWLGLRLRLPPTVWISFNIFHAAASELIQYNFITGRSGDFIDLAADLIGVGLGATIYLKGKKCQRAH